MKVLLIDDDEDEYILNRDLLDDIKNRSFKLDWADNYEDALDALVEGSHDAYLLDYRLGAHTGIDLLREIQSRGLHRATIFLTGQGDDAVDQSAMELGASDYLIKGEVSASTLERAIRYAIEQEKAKERLKFQAEILKNVHDAVFYVDKSGRIEGWNEGATRIFGLSAEEIFGRSIREICPSSHGSPFDDRIIPAIEEHGMAEEVIQCESRSGEDLYIRAKVTPMVQSGMEGYVFCASDITKQKKLEAEIVRISENEQRRIGQDLHDDLCSQLSGIGCLTKVLEQQLRSKNQEEADLLRKVTEMVAQAGVRTREIAKGLVPTVLETQGLSGAIDELVSRQRDVYGVACVAQLSNDSRLDDLPSHVSIQLYRIVQEALANSIKHSDCEEIEVRLEFSDGRLDLSIRDDGKGMKPDDDSSGMGLFTMRRRAEIIGAEFDLHGSPGDGTRIRCSLRLPIA
jgi:PAS domain S-box-containing protein